MAPAPNSDEGPLTNDNSCKIRSPRHCGVKNERLTVPASIVFYPFITFIFCDRLVGPRYVMFSLIAAAGRSSLHHICEVSVDNGGDNVVFACFVGRRVDNVTDV